MFVESQLILILLSLFILINLFDNKIVRSFLSILISIFFFLELISYYLTGELIDYRFFIYSDPSSINTFLFQFIKEFIFLVFSFLLTNLILINKNFVFVKNFRKITYSILFISLLGLIIPNKSAIHKILEINSFYDKNPLSFVSKNIDDKNLNNFIKENNLDTLLKKNEIKGKKNKNIIFISLESLDSGFIESTPELTPNLNRIKKEYNYLEINQTPGCDWSIAALYCLMTSVPSFFPFEPNKIFEGVAESKIINLGYLLKKVGYENISYYIGNADFSGTRDLLTIFDVEVNDYNQSTGNYNISPNNHGYHDKDLFFEIKSRIKKSKSQDESFAIFASTINTHLNGIKDERMSQFISGNFENELEHSVLSLDYLIKDFFDFLDEENLLENTLLILTPDHLLPNNIGAKNTFKKISKEERSLYILSNKKIISNKKNNSQLGLSKILLDTAEVDHNHKFYFEIKEYEDLNDFSEKNKEYFSKFNQKMIKYEKIPEEIKLLVNEKTLKLFKDENIIFEKLLKKDDPSYINLIFDKNFILKKELSRFETINPIKISKEDKSFEYYYISIFKNDNKLVNVNIFNTNNKKIVKLPLNLMNGFSFKPSKILNKKNDYEIFKDRKRYIAHAGGEIMGNTYTNSLEALNNSYKNGFRYFELDMIVTADNYIVASHDWEMWAKQTNFNGKLPPTLKEFKKYKILNKFTALDYKDINKWFADHKDAYLVTDKIENISLIENLLNIEKKRIMIEVFNQDILKELISKDYKVIPFLGLLKSMPEPIKYLKENDIEYVSTSHKIKRLLKKNHIHYWFNIFNPVLERDLINNGFKFIAFNLNQKRRNISEIELMCNYSDVFYGIYADKWNFDKKTYCNE